MRSASLTSSCRQIGLRCLALDLARAYAICSSVNLDFFIGPHPLIEDREAVQGFLVSTAVVFGGDVSWNDSLHKTQSLKLVNPGEDCLSVVSEQAS